MLSIRNVQIVYGMGVLHGNNTAFDAVWRRYQTADLAAEQSRCLDALTLTQNVTALSK